MARSNQEMFKGAELREFSTKQLWLTWLAEHFQQTDALWVKFAKKGSDCTSLTYEESREAAIAYGWIDGLINTWDNDWYLRRFTRRRPRSLWSQINRGIAEQLIQQKRMKPSGLVEVEAAKADGRWQAAYSAPSQIQTPDDLLGLLEQKKNTKAREFFGKLKRTDRYSFLFRLETARKPGTRLRWLDRIVLMLGNGDTFRSQVKKKK